MTDADASDDVEPTVRSANSVSLTAAEEAVTHAELRAQQARIRATQLRRQAETASGDVTPDPDSEKVINVETVEPSSARARRLRSWRPRPPSLTTVGIGAAVVLIVSSLLAGGFMLHQHMSLERERKHVADSAAAARRGIEMMLSIDPKRARENVQALIDNTTGELQSQLRATSAMLVEDTEKAKVTTKANVQDVAVESTAGDTAVVLVVAQSDTTNPDNSKRPPVFWRISVALTRSSGQLKMSKVDFVQ